MQKIFSWLKTAAPVAVLLALSLAAVSCKDKYELIPVLTLAEARVSGSGGSVELTVGAAAHWTLSAEYLCEETGWCSFDPAEGDGFATVSISCEQNPSSNPRDVRIVIRTPENKVSTILTQTGAASTGVPQWLELPRMGRSGLIFAPHDMNGNPYINLKTSGIRNWSCYFDPDAAISPWVAYPLNPGLRGSGERVDKWGEIDPCVPEDKQINLGGGSYGGGWVRGHQLPSADRLASEANRSTFYSTNITPQNYDFNGGIWLDLENKVRVYSAASDTLYVCTGAKYDSSSAWSGTSRGRAARVPDAYYKVLLRYKKGDPTGEFSAAAFYLPHSASIAGEDFMNYATTVKDVESKTGEVFFASFASIYGEAMATEIKTADPETTLANWK
ncbi:MAG: DNA/RNA non-specific endonuclease [Bacteroidales bacterium]|nr:DNA/RNA non-specific endonuclease [Bacteroidales bacterium]